MLHVGWASASSTVTLWSSSRLRPRKGPPEAVSTSESTEPGSATLEALEERGVLRVDGQQSSSTPLLRGEGERSGGDKALLVRKRERDAALERPERRADAGEADDSVQDDVRLRGLQQPCHVTADLRVRDAVLPRQRGQIGRARCESTELELGVPLHDLDRLPADRAGGAEQRYPLHGHSVPYARAMTT